ncbi:FAD-dependent monooxygenase [Rickettsiella endosymbiont of Dermanyssus gallinae]|uniref:FAD-dependent monooxygenase n=1 Tax=Rickettsiella endosymbiont of Dermanyssus gallinae TaxID=2856608 RepID=UPI001C52D02C|nr:FAD-dependent monooxygenase [Rickettsiella endosymbiont of Dermanyssus gallinae]
MVECDVLIVGAGPVGLTLAIILKKFNISYKIIDKAYTWSSKSKAMTITSRTLELLNTIGIAENIIKEGIPSYYLNYFYNKYKLGQAKFSRLDSKYNFILQISQSITTKILNDQLENLDTTVERGLELTSFERNDRWITCYIYNNRSDIHSNIRTNYLIACDGGHSAIRKSDGMIFHGEEDDETFLMADIPIKNLPLAFDQRHLFYLMHSFLYIMPITYNGNNFIYRIITTEKNKTEYTNNSVLELFKKHLCNLHYSNIEFGDPIWISTFNPKQYVVNSFYRNKVIYVGDAAHIQSPIGSQGLNTGIQDAFNLGWKLSFVLQNGWSQSILNSYNAERKAVANKLFDYNNFISKVVFGHKPIKRFFSILSKATLGIDFYNLKEVEIISQYRVNYNKVNRSPIIGSRMPNFKLDDERSIYDVLCPTKFNLILFDNKNISNYTKTNSLINLILIEKKWNKLKNEFFLKALAYLIRPDCYIMDVLNSEIDIKKLISSEEFFNLYVHKRLG